MAVLEDRDHPRIGRQGRGAVGWRPMRDALIAFPCSVFLGALFAWHAGPSPAGFRAAVAIAAVMAAAWIAWIVLERPKVLAKERSLRRQVRRANGQCQDCGYDLTGNVSGVCPECGASH